MSSIFGGDKSSTQQQATSTSDNQAYPMLSNALNPTIQTGGQANNQLGNMLGLNGAQGQNDAFKNWQGSTGYQFGLNQGMQAINGNAAASGVLNSGATAKALNTYGQNYANTQYGNYTNQLQGLAGNGLAGAGVVAGAGQESHSSETSNSSASKKPGIGGFVGGLLGK